MKDNIYHTLKKVFKHHGLHLQKGFFYWNKNSFGKSLCIIINDLFN